jgi:hypothetical protein
MQNLRGFCKITESPSKDLKTNVSSSIFILSPRFWTTIFWPAVLEITRTQNLKFECVRRETKKKKKKKKKKKRKTRDALLKCYASHRIKYRVNGWATNSTIIIFLYIYFLVRHFHFHATATCKISNEKVFLLHQFVFFICSSFSISSTYVKWRVHWCSTNNTIR